MHTIRRIAVGVTFLASWLLLLVRFGASQYDARIFNTTQSPSISYINNIGIAVAMMWVLPGACVVAIITGRMEHQSIQMTLWACFHLIVFLVCILGGADLGAAVAEIASFNAVHCDVAFICTATISYAMIPPVTKVVASSEAHSMNEMLIRPNDTRQRFEISDNEEEAVIDTSTKN